MFFFQQQPTFYDDFNFTESESQVLQNLLREIEVYNPFLQSVGRAVMTNQQMPLYKLIISDVPPIQAAPRTYNVPTCTEVSAIIVRDGVGSEAWS